MSAHAGIRGPGKYSGVVVFDRWDTCLLLDGLYVMYISGNAKEQLRQYADTAVEIDATQVFQPVNPGEARIEEYTVTSPAPGKRSNFHLEVEDDFKWPGTPAFVVTFENVGLTRAEIAKSQIGVTLLGSNYGPPFVSPSDGRSVAWITRTGLHAGLWEKSASRELTSTTGQSRISWKYIQDPACEPSDAVDLNPGQSLSCRIGFDLPAGHYQVIVGYGKSGKTQPVASNSISFRVTDEGIAILE